MLALKNALEKMGARVFINKYSPNIDVHICNSLWFDEKKFVGMASRHHVKMIHRIDGPVSLYRGTDRREDDRLHDFNLKYATATVYQSAYCLKKTIELGYHPVRPLVILNSVNDEIFNAKGRSTFSMSRKIRLISSSWSDNPRKGGPFYRWLDSVLDWSRFEFTFVGRTKEHFQYIKHIPPQDSENLARLLRQHDIFIAPSKHEPCSNAILEALACGLPVLYRNDGGSPELVRFGGLPFQGRDDVLSQLDRIVEFYESFQSVIFIKPIKEIASAYLELARQIAA
jgi:glycosyltransferase involved in cell wall biosynthesis